MLKRKEIGTEKKQDTLEKLVNFYDYFSIRFKFGFGFIV